MFKSSLLKLSLAVLAISSIVACNKDEDPLKVTPNDPNNPNNPAAVVVIQKNLFAPQTGSQGAPSGGPFTLFSFSKNSVVSDSSWDIALRGTTLMINGGKAIGVADEPARSGLGACSIVGGTFDGVTEIPAENTFRKDSTSTYAIPTGSGNGWYSYDAIANTISPIAGRVFVIRTHDGKYAKMEILSYYKDAPSSPNALTSTPRYYTFRFAYQATGTAF